jgi:phosphomannomutase
MTLMMSVSGVRGIIGRTMTPALAVDLGCAFGTYLEGGTVVIGRDSRPSGPMLQNALVAGLLATGCRVIQLDIASTPATAFMVRRHQAAGGVVITASHNPIIWNGMKFLTSEGLAPPPELAKRIFELYHAKNFRLVDIEGVRQPEFDASAAEAHVAKVLETADVEKIRGRKFKVVLDSVNGAGGIEGRQLLEALGCTIVHINGEPTGRFAHTPEPLAENLTELCDVTAREKADIGFAQDPDADRLVVVNEKGQFIGEEYTLALAARYFFAAHPGPAAANLSSSRMIDDLAVRAGGPCRVYRSPVGEANVVEAMKTNGCVFGGEGNGGVIDPRVVPVRDSLVSIALALQLMAESGKTVGVLAAEIPAYVMIKQKFECTRERIEKVLVAVREGYSGQRLNDSDGVRIDFDRSWVHVRASNTEPILRIIAEAPDRQQAESLINNVRQLADSV